MANRLLQEQAHSLGVAASLIELSDVPCLIVLGERVGLRVSVQSFLLICS